MIPSIAYSCVTASAVVYWGVPTTWLTVSSLLCDLTELTKSSMLCAKVAAPVMCLLFCMPLLDECFCLLPPLERSIAVEFIMSSVFADVDLRDGRKQRTQYYHLNPQDNRTALPTPIGCEFHPASMCLPVGAAPQNTRSIKSLCSKGLVLHHFRPPIERSINQPSQMVVPNSCWAFPGIHELGSANPLLI